jgi:hypothetical protein
MLSNFACAKKIPEPKSVGTIKIVNMPNSDQKARSEE